MIKRHLDKICFHHVFGRQMRFIAGPRQVGKTTLVKKFLESKQLEKLYFNWDLREIRDKFKNDPYFFETPLYDSKPPTGLPWVCHDEIHKMPKWKNIESLFDLIPDRVGSPLSLNSLVAVELKTMIELWNDSGIGKFGLFYVRTKDKKKPIS